MAKTTKKSTKKAAAKKSTKKAAPKKEAKSTKKAAKPREKKEGLRKPQEAILKALSKSAKPLSRAEVAEKAPCDVAGCTEWIGSSDPGMRAANDKKHFPSLISLGLVRDEVHEGENSRSRITYSLTAAGKKAAKNL